MSILINFKICSNDSPCNALRVCPTKAVIWNAEKRTLEIDNSKCISCGACVKVCPIAAIRVAKTKTEYDAIKAEYDADPRRAEDLQVDRYGAGAVETPTLSPDEAATFTSEQKGLICLELQLDNNDMPCQFLSIPISELMDLNKITYRAVANGKTIAKNYNVSEIPALVFFKNGIQFGKIEGYFGDNETKDCPEKYLLKKLVNDILKGKEPPDTI